MSTSSSVAFSPDGKWLLTLGGECELSEVGTWEKKRSLGKGHGFAFTSDCRMVAIGSDSGMVRLGDELVHHTGQNQQFRLVVHRERVMGKGRHREQSGDDSRENPGQDRSAIH